MAEKRSFTLSDRADENANIDYEKYYHATVRNANRVVRAVVRGR
ncbi:MAG: hypothetical protein NTW14_08135 [bacterium]|nr:hypothetical protein [bacterium]